MPSTPRRKQQVIKMLTEKLKFTFPERRKRKADMDIENQVINYYLRDDNSIWTPGVKEYVSIYENGQKVKKQKRYRKMTLMEL